MIIIRNLFIIAFLNYQLRFISSFLSASRFTPHISMIHRARQLSSCACLILRDYHIILKLELFVICWIAQHTTCHLCPSLFIIMSWVFITSYFARVRHGSPSWPWNFIVQWLIIKILQWHLLMMCCVEWYATHMQPTNIIFIEICIALIMMKSDPMINIQPCWSS